MDRWRVLILIDKARRGDKAATDELMRLALKGDPDARLVIIRGVSGSVPSEETLAEEDEGGSSGESACSGLDYTEELWDLLELANVNPRRALSRIHSELLRDSNSDCRQALLLATLAQLLKWQGHYDEANKVLDYAEIVAAKCPAMLADLWRRRAVLRANEGLYASGFEYIGRSLAYYRSTKGPGHDPCGNGIANCRYVRADLRFHTRDIAGAISDLTRCLAELGPKQAPELFGYAILNLAIIYSRMGQESQREAFEIFGKIRRRFRGHRGESVPRALLDWWEGMIRLKLGKGRPGRAIRMMMDAQLVFIHQGMRKEAVAVTVDTVRALGIDTDKIKVFLGKRLAGVRTAAGGQFSHLLDSLERVTRPKDVNLARLDSITSALRKAADGPDVFPSLV